MEGERLVNETVFSKIETGLNFSPGWKLVIIMKDG